jgi:hypothetical protein
MVEKVSHTAVTTHTAPFTLNGGIYSANLSGTIANGTDAIEMQHLVNGSFVSVDPPIRFLSTDKGGTKLSGLLSAGSYRWTVPGSGHSINTNVVGS